MDSITSELKVKEETHKLINEKHFGEATVNIFDLAAASNATVKSTCIDVVSAQKLLSNQQTILSKMVDNVIDDAIQLNSDIAVRKKEAISISGIETWIVNITAEMKQMKEEALFLHQVLQDDFKNAMSE